jgi:ATP-dependent HslUV protease ATP-binding subunit HslU
LANAPFIKVEASKFTEVGYVGRDVESMIRELMNIALNQVKTQMMQDVQTEARHNAKQRLIDILYPAPPAPKDETQEEAKTRKDRYQRIRKKMENLFDSGNLDDREVEVSVEKPGKPHLEFMGGSDSASIDLQIGDIVSGLLPFNRKGDKKKKMKVKEAYDYLTEVEANRLVDKEKVRIEAKKRVENDGIIFIDEIDKIAAMENNRSSADVSRSGVQRDLLPIVEGSNVPTKYGIINTSHILFIAAGAFSTSKPSDLIPELQGRFPIRQELNSLSQEDLKKILVYPKNSLTKQYKAMFASENVQLVFREEAIDAISDYAAKANAKMEDIGARRLHTIMNALLEDYLFEMPTKKYKRVTITKKIVNQKLRKLIKDEDLSKYIL